MNIFPLHVGAIHVASGQPNRLHSSRDVIVPKWVQPRKAEGTATPSAFLFGFLPTVQPKQGSEAVMLANAGHAGPEKPVLPVASKNGGLVGDRLNGWAEARINKDCQGLILSVPVWEGRGWVLQREHAPRLAKQTTEYRKRL